MNRKPVAGAHTDISTIAGVQPVAHTISRRGLMKGALVASAIVTTLGRFAEEARADNLTPLDANDSNAKALMFAPDAAKIDPHANPTFKAGQRCSGCAHYKGKQTDSVAACETFPGHSVPASGWCMVWGAR
jgi:hypothetical protein